MGVYRLKRVSHVGRIVAVAVCRRHGGELIVEAEEYEKLSEVHKDRIQAIMSASDAYYTQVASCQSDAR
jgi:hypothetical protein